MWQAFGPAVKILVSHIMVPGFDSKLWFLTAFIHAESDSASQQCERPGLGSWLPILALIRGRY